MQKITYSKTQKIVLSGLFIAIGVLLPQIFHAFGGAGPIFLPMHIPVFLAGILIGPFSGLLVALVAPTLSHLVSGMPLLALLPFMTIELIFYGLISGLLRSKIPVFFSLLLAQLGGRILYAGALVLLGLILQVNVPFPRAVLTALSIGIPGIIIQLILVPSLVKIIQKGSR